MPTKKASKILLGSHRKAMSKEFRLKDYDIKSRDSFLFDNNILMFLFAPLGNYNRNYQESYSRFFETIKTTGASLHLPAIILSEFYNTNLRIDYNEWLKQPENIGKKYKPHYVGSLVYRNTVEALNGAINQICKSFTLEADQLNNLNLSKILKEMPQRDFNDNFILEIAWKRKLKIVSHDRDLLNSNWDIEIISALV